MISQLTGKIIEKDLDSIIIQVNNVGYKIFISNNTLESLMKTPKDKEITILTYLAVKENALDLYGFKNSEEKEIFELLLTISGIGPKSAIAILSSADSEIIKESVLNEDPEYLSKISGLGKKKAEKIVLGLKDKFGIIEPGERSLTSDSAVVIEALVSLGYSERESRNALKKLKKDSDFDKTNHQEIIKEALKILNNN